FAASGAGEIVGGENRFDARNRERRGGVDSPHPRMRHRAREQLAEQHALGPVVLGVFRAARYLGNEIGRRVVGAGESVGGHASSLWREGESQFLLDVVSGFSRTGPGRTLPTSAADALREGGRRTRRRSFLS